MATTTISWGDGSGDNIYLTYPSASGDQIVSVSSDANTGAARTKVVIFNSEVENITKQLTVSQDAGVVEHTLVVNLSSYDSSDKSYYSLTGSANAYQDPETNTTACGVNMTRGSGANTWVYFKFDTSDLPENATIVSVSCKAKAGCSSQNTNYIASKSCVMCSGTTIKTDSIIVQNTPVVRTFETATWTREELSDVRLKLYGTRGTQNTTSTYTLRMYGATLTIKYTV